MEVAMEDVVIVGAGIAGLSTALGLHRLGLRSLVLESSESLRASGFALGVWTNAWRALDALGVGDTLRQRYLAIRGFEFLSVDSRPPEQSQQQNRTGNIENRVVRRKELLELLEKGLPEGTIRYSSKVVSIEDSGNFKLVHLADGSVIQTKVIIGCDGVKSVVSERLGLEKPTGVGRAAVRGFVEFPDSHNFNPKFYAHFGGGIRFGFVPCDDKSIYWFCTYTKSITNCHEDMTGNPVKMKEFVLSQIAKNVPKEVSDVVERTKLESVAFADVRIRMPWDILLMKIAEKNICVAGDAFHPMTPDLAQGGCSALEDGVVLARCIGESFREIQKGDFHRGREDAKEEEEIATISKGLEKYAKYRRWRSFSLVAAAYLVGFVQENDQNKLMHFLREKFLFKYSVGVMMKMAQYDCGGLE